MKPAERREQLLAYMARNCFVTKPTVEYAVHMSSLYLLRHPTDWEAQFARCRRDLDALEQEGKIRRLPGRPARWEVVR